MARLPDELVINIFRDVSFSHHDLTKLALVSKRYLDSVRRSLYAIIKVTITRILLGKYGFDDTSRELFRFLSRSRLSPIVQEVQLDCPSALVRRPDGGEGLEFLLSIVNNHTFNCTCMTFSLEFSQRELLNAATVATDSKICRIRAARVPYDLLYETADKLESLQVEHIVGVQVAQLGAVPFPKLTHLDIKSDVSSGGDLGFLLHVRTTLRILRINLETATKIDYSTMPHLEELHLYNVDSLGGLGRV
jgi:hypothetical protein